MGAAESRHEKTDWATVDGGMKDGDVTLAGNTPTHGPKTITLKKTNMVKNRIYDILDDRGNLLLQVKETPVCIQWFELTTPDKGSPPQFQHLARGLKKLKTPNTWTIVSYLNPAFPGQEADKTCRMENEYVEDVQRPLYPIYELHYNASKSHATICPIVKDPSGENKTGVKGEPVLILEKVKSLNREIYQTSKPGAEELSSYWTWENTFTEHKMVLKTSKGVDLSLHCILAVLVNVVKETEKFPFLGAMTE
mmetsp:Transcript_11888/g.28062  ORF Transcript_11888/g.28062 Transcript_11888/m.28062 type:complete len:251 (+) Transcript_11888:87-839(+)|eukprot:CAMPEP_0185822492 /NCGR_PEP_ID=MMETSP1322-20130828/26817_1 /TAXON_ID=265543 /ORGANISM="Minutocellus polymorphus, Strain RCC2270" /LENGTH=250 /DNA_ID=CAMNT_0028519965 /DNA_START=140 /DNA_END=892 /DNA_ORIENTATION=-